MTNPVPTNDVTSLDYGKTPEQLAAEQAAAAAGVVQKQPVYFDFWGKERTEKYYFPGQEDVPEDYRQYIEFQPMNEGRRARFQKATSRGLVVDKNTGNTRMGIDIAGDREALMKASVVDWRMAQNGTLIKYSERKFLEWFTNADPKIIDELAEKIQKANPWMINELEPDEIQAEIDNLQERLAEAKERKAKDADFQNKSTDS